MRSPLVCCNWCGRDTRDRSHICDKCRGSRPSKYKFNQDAVGAEMNGDPDNKIDDEAVEFEEPEDEVEPDAD